MRVEVKFTVTNAACNGLGHPHAENLIVLLTLIRTMHGCLISPLYPTPSHASGIALSAQAISEPGYLTNAGHVNLARVQLVMDGMGLNTRLRAVLLVPVIVSV